MTKEQDSDTAKASESEANKHDFTQNLTDAINQLKEAKDGLVKRFEEAREAADEETSDLQVALNQAAELLGEGTAKVKAAYEQAGGAKGISESTVKKAAEVGARAKVISENVADSEGFKAALNGVKSGATKVQETNFFKDLQEHALNLKKIAEEAYKDTYDKKKAEASDTTDVDTK
jgi:hypothetical protein